MVYIQMGGEGEIVVQAINKMEETIRRSHRTDWEEVDRLYSVALAWATAREVNNKAHRCTVLHNSASQTHVLRYTEVLEELAHCDLGTTVEEVERSLRAGVYIGLNMAHYRTGSGPLLCCFVGDEWAAQVQKLCSANACTHLVRPELLPLPDDRIGWLLPSHVTVQYHVFQRGDDDTAIAHLLCAVLTDSVRVAESCIFLYARLGLGV